MSWVWRCTKVCGKAIRRITAARHVTKVAMGAVAASGLAVVRVGATHAVYSCHCSWVWVPDKVPSPPPFGFPPTGDPATITSIPSGPGLLSIGYLTRKDLMMKDTETECHVGMRNDDCHQPPHSSIPEPSGMMTLAIFVGGIAAIVRARFGISA